MSQLPSMTPAALAGRGTLRTIFTAPLLALLGLSLLLGALFVHLGDEVRERDTLATDQSILRTIDRATASVPVGVANAASFPGAEVVVGTVGLLLCGATFLRRRWLDALFVAAAIGGYVVLTYGVKLVVHRERPLAFFRVPESGYSFPSGHTLGATCLAVALGYFLWRGRHARGMKIFGTLALVVGVLIVGGSRLVLGVHYPTDVAGSMLLGAGWMAALVTARLAAERWQRR